MKSPNLPFNWFDVLLVAVLVVGIFRGRKRGMSVEIFTMLQWLAIVVAAGFGYAPIGDLLASVTPFSRLTCYILCYLLIVALVCGLFVMIRKSIGGKVAGSDTFGQGEYYMGMPAGMLRFACIAIAALALLNARFYTTKEINDAKAYQKDMYGSEFFPGLQSIQEEVFEKSFLGPQIKNNLAFLLIKPTPTEVKQLTRNRQEAGVP